MDDGSPGRRRLRRGVAASLAVAALVAGAATVALAGPSPPDRSLIDRTVLTAMRSHGIPGVLVAVTTAGGSYQRGYGLADLATRTPMRPRLHVRVSGLTPTFIATAVLEQVARGRIATSQRVTRWVGGGSTGTVGQLLAADSARNEKLLTAVLERSTRRSVRSVVTDSVIKPARLGSTNLSPDGRMTPPYAHGYCGRRDCTASDPDQPEIVSTIRDVQRWGKTLATGALLPSRLRGLMSPLLVHAGDWLGGAGTGLGFSVATLYEPATGSQIALIANTSSASALAIATMLAEQTSAPTLAAGSRPQVTGSPRAGQSASIATGHWNGTQPIQLAYRWQRCDGSSNSCQTIAGADGQTYMPGQPDVGSTLRALVIASNHWGRASATTGPSAVVQAAAPASSGPGPSISGTARDGQTLTASPGSWAGSAPITYAYQWQRCDASGASCHDVSAATGQSYGLGSDDVGFTLRVVVTASNGSLPGGGSGQATSPQTGVVQAIPPSNSAPPQVSGTDRSEQTLTASPGSWSGSAPITYAYQWQRCNAAGASCTNVPGANSSQYVLSNADVDSRMEVTVTATNPGASTPATSTQSQVVGAARDPVIVAVGDIACPESDTTDPCVEDKTAALAQAQNPDDVLVLGDNQYNSGTPQEFTTGAKSYDKTWGVFNAIVHPVPGNHEYVTPGATGYFGYFGASANPYGQASPTGSYSFNLGTWHMIALNSNCSDNRTPSCEDEQAGETTAAQNAWLQSDLASDTSECTLAFWHHPLFSDGFVGPSPDVAPLWTELSEAHADVVLNGHDHLYERYAQLDPAGDPTTSGIREIVAGAGGEIMDTDPIVSTAGQPYPEFNDPKDFGVLVMTLHPTRYDWKFISIGTNGDSPPTVTDSGTSDCHGPATASAARDVAAPHLARLSGSKLVFAATPLHRSLTAVAQAGLPVAIHCSRRCDVAVTVWLRQGARRERIASFEETESEIPWPYSRIHLHLPARALRGSRAVTLVLRFVAVDAANHHRALVRTVRLAGR